MGKVLANKTASLNYLSGPTVKIIVGGGVDEDGQSGKNTSSTQTFFVHKDLLVSRSSFFAKAFKGYTPKNLSNSDISRDPTFSELSNDSFTWLEAETGEIEMSEDEPDVFANYIQLIYTGSIAAFVEMKMKTGYAAPTSRSQVRRKMKSKILQHVDEEQSMLGDMYVLCEKIQDLQAKHSIRAAMLESVDQERASLSGFCPSLEVIKEVYSGTLPGDQMRILLTNLGVSDGHGGWFPHSETSDYHPDYLVDVVRGMWKHRARPDNAWREDIMDLQTYTCKEVERTT